MDRWDRRIPFFLIAAAAAFALRFVLLDSEERIVKNVPIGVGIIYLVLALLFQLQWMSMRAEQRDRERTDGVGERTHH